MAVTINITSPTGSEIKLAEWFSAANVATPLSATAGEYFIESNGSFFEGRVHLHFKSSTNDLTFDGDNLPSGGTFDSLEIFSVALNQVVAVITGLSYSATQLYSEIISGNADLTEYLFLEGGVSYTGDDGPDSFTSKGAAADNLAGGKGDDYLDAGFGGGMVSGGEGNDTLKSGGDATLDGGDGNDFLEGGPGSTDFVGGDGFDTINYANAEIFKGKGISYTGAGVVFSDGGYQDTYSSIEKVIGSAFDDDITDADDSMHLDGGAGKDFISGGKGDDWINGGAGVDTLDGGEGTDTLSFEGAAVAVNVTLGAAGTEKIGAGGEAAGDKFKNFENIVGGNGGDTLTGNELNNILYGGLGKDNITGADGNDRILGAEDNDTINGGIGDDLLDGGAGADSITGNTGFDTVTYVNSVAAVTVNYATNINKGGDAEGEKLFTIERIIGSKNADILTGNGTLILEGGVGSDTIIGKLNDYASYQNSQAAVTLDLTVTAQTSTGDASGDQLSGILNLIGSDSADKFTGNDKDNIFQGLNGADIIDGGAGVDTLNYAASAAGVNINLGANGDGTGFGGDAEGDQYIRIENVIGTDFADAIIGHQVANKIIAGKGDDEIDGGAGADLIDGGEGVDTIYYDTSDAAVTVNLATNINTGGTAQGDKLTSIENIGGSDFKDKLTGSSVANAINGGADDDTIDGGSGNDVLLGGSGKDTIIGNAGDDLIFGNGDADILDGSAGIDTLSYANGPAAVRVKLSEAALAQAQAGALTVNGVNINLGNGDATGNSVKNFENLVGTNFDDVLVGNNGANSIYGGIGKDNIEGGKGNDIIEGGAGADVLNGGTGTSMDVNAGIDTLSYASDTVGVLIDLSNNSAMFGDAAGDVFSNFRNVLGGSGGDTLIGDAAVNILTGGAGLDLFSGGGGKDILDGGTDEDIVDYTMLMDGITLTLGVNGAQTVVTGKAGADATGDSIKNIESIYGTKGNDTLTGNALTNSISGNDGDDLIQGGAGTDTLDGGYNGSDTSLNDTISYAASLAGVSVLINNAMTTGFFGDAEGDQIQGFENIIGSAKNDELRSFLLDSVNTIKGGAGDDIIEGGEGADFLFGDAGSDTLSYANSVGVVVTLKGSLAADVSGSVLMFNHAKGDIAIGFENLVGGNGVDKLTGDNGANVIAGGSNADFLDGGAGNDTVSYADYMSGFELTLGFNGAETFNSLDNDSVKNFENISGGKGLDKLTGNNLVNILFGDAGDDTLIGGAGADTLNGGTGFDTADYSDLTAAQSITVTLGKGGAASTVTSTSGSPAQNDKLIDIEIVKGGAGNDKFTGSNLDSVFYGNDGNDLFIGNEGQHVFLGGNGSDTVNYALSNLGVSINLAANNVGGGFGEGDNISSIENVVGSAHNDVVAGNDEGNTISLGAGNDVVFDGAWLGADVLDGGSDSALNAVFGSSKGDVLDYSAMSGVDITLTLGVNGAQTVMTATGVNADMVNGDKISNFETIWAANGKDVLKGNNLANDIRGGGGDDYIDGGAGNDILIGEGGTDTLSYVSATAGVTVNLGLSTAQNTVGAGIDTVIAFENLIGTAKADRLLGDGTNNIIEGGDGDDFINGGGGVDTLIGGAGINTLTFENSGNITIDLSVQDGVTGQAGTGDAAGDIISGFQNVIGNDSINRLTGNAAVNILKGMAQSDVIQGGGGADTLDGGTDVDILNYKSDMAGVTVTLGFNGAQTIGKGGDAEGDKILNFEFIWGGNGKDVLTGNNLSNEIFGGAGDDILDGGAGDDYLNGEGGANNTASYLSATVGVTIDLNMVGGQQNTVGSGIDTLVNINSLIGSNKNDVLTASSAALTVDGAGGDDKINGSAFDDDLLGGAGNDNIIGGGGQDVIEGGAGNDIIDGGVGISDVASYASATAAVTVNLQLAVAQNTGGAGIDTLIGIERLVGSKFNDMLTGGPFARLDGGEGNDVIVCAGISDTLIGGLGNDNFRFNSAFSGNSIVDFGTGLDKIQISKTGFGIGASVTLNGVGVNNFAAEYFVSGAGAVADKAHGQFVFDTDTSRLYWDADGTGGGAATMIVDFDNNHMLLATEFTLI